MNTIEILTHLARRYQDVKQPGYPFKAKLERLEQGVMQQGEAIQYKKRVVSLVNNFKPSSSKLVG